MILNGANFPTCFFIGVSEARIALRLSRTEGNKYNIEMRAD